MRVLFALAFSFSVFAQNYVAAPVENIYIPMGFDANDQVEIIVHGWLPSTCYHSPQYSVKKIAATRPGDKPKIDIKVGAIYQRPSSGFCLQMIDPYTIKVELRQLKAGNYDIRVNGKTRYEKRSSLYIDSTSEDAPLDEYHYARVEFIEPVIGHRAVLLKGYNPSECMVLDRIDYKYNNKDTIAIMPIMKQVREFCPMKMTKFEYLFEIPSEIDAKRFLIHVRAKSGRSVNMIYSNALSTQP
jgi:hypothetical protein